MKILQWVGLGSLMTVALCAEVGAATTPKTFTAGEYSLTLEGTSDGFIEAAEGGDVVATVVESVPLENGYVNKRLSTTVQEPIRIRAGFGLAGGLYQWMKDGVGKGALSRNGEIVITDANFAATSRRTFTQAMIAEIAFPKFDALSKEAMSFLVTVQPVSSGFASGGGQKISSSSTKSKAVLASNFRLAIDGLDCTKVARVEGLRVTQDLVLENGVLVPGPARVSNLTVSLFAVSSDTWFAWFNSFVVNGQNGDDQERQGSLTLLAPNLSTAIATIKLTNLGIVSIGAERADGWLTRKGAKDAAERIVVELYCEGLELTVN